MKTLQFDYIKGCHSVLSPIKLCNGKSRIQLNVYIFRTIILNTPNAHNTSLGQIIPMELRYVMLNVSNEHQTSIVQIEFN
jgi:hypothetical protein